MNVPIKILTKEEFSKDVEEFSVSRNTSFLDATIHILAERGIEIESISALLTPHLKEKIELEAAEMKLVQPKDKSKIVFDDNTTKG